VAAWRREVTQWRRDAASTANTPLPASTSSVAFSPVSSRVVSSPTPWVRVLVSCPAPSVLDFIGQINFSKNICSIDLFVGDSFVLRPSRQGGFSFPSGKS
jgi:hypothetical protein